jgi:hypothetical protein
VSAGLNTSTSRGFEPWAFGAFTIAAATVGLYLFLGSRPGGAGPVLAYRFGLLVLGWAAAVGMLVALAWSLRRRPVLQRGRVWPLGALGASLWFCSLPIAYPSSHEGKFSATRFELPFEGPARVRYGGEHKTQNPLVFDPARRFGTGFERTGGAPLTVLAPAAGTLRARAPGRGGDALVLCVGEREFLVLEGIDALSCTLESGAEVAQGERLGLAPGVLYAHLQDAPEAGHGEGIPLRYWSYLADGRAAEAGVPVPPQEVARGVAALPPSSGR